MSTEHSRDLPVLAPEEGWIEFTLAHFNHLQPKFIAGDESSDRLRIRYFLRESDNAVAGFAWFGPGTQGPPGHAHGGSISALLDEAMGTAAWQCGMTVVAAQLTVNFRRPVPLGIEASFEAWIEKIEGRKVTTRGRLFTADGTLFSEASALFLVVDIQKLAAMNAGTSPAAHAEASD